MSKNQATKMVTAKVRTSYFYAIVPAEDKDDAGNSKTLFRTQIIIDKTDKVTLDRMKACIKAAIQEATGKKWNGTTPAKLALPLRDGDTETGEDGKPLPPDIYSGKWFMNVKTADKPGIVGTELDAEGQPLPLYLRNAAGEPQVDDLYGGYKFNPHAINSGDYVRVSLNFYGYSYMGKKGVSAGLNNVQFLSKGLPLGSKRSASQDFADGFVDDEADETQTGEDALSGLLGD
jgi:hypothetical protein